MNDIYQVKIAQSLDKFLAQRPGLEFNLQRLRQNAPKMATVEGVQWVNETLRKMHEMRMSAGQK